MVFEGNSISQIFGVFLTKLVLCWSQPFQHFEHVTAFDYFFIIIADALIQFMISASNVLSRSPGTVHLDGFERWTTTLTLLMDGDGPPDGWTSWRPGAHFDILT